jgi:hypothetical protein
MRLKFTRLEKIGFWHSDYLVGRFFWIHKGIFAFVPVNIKEDPLRFPFLLQKVTKQRFHSLCRHLQHQVEQMSQKHSWILCLSLNSDKKQRCLIV